MTHSAREAGVAGRPGSRAVVACAVTGMYQDIEDGEIWPTPTTTGW